MRQTNVRNNNKTSIPNAQAQQASIGGRTSVGLADLAAVLHDMAVGKEHNDRRETPDEAAPPLVREDVCEERTTFAQVCARRGAPSASTTAGPAREYSLRRT